MAEESADKFYVTTPIYYVNARPHIGHAYTTIVADVLARRHRLLGHDTFFLTGTDEHGQKIERSAAAARIAPQQFADEVSAEFEGLWKRMGITNDEFIRTTSEKHKRGAQKLFAELYQRGAIYLSSYTGQYSIGEEIFVEGPPGTIGPDGKPTETVTEENFFFRLSDYQLPLLDLIESDTLAITPESRKNEVLGFLRGNIAEAREQGRTIATSAKEFEYVAGNLRDLSVSRSSFTWGIPVPEPAASATEKKHVMYVWLDALANYMSAVGYGSDAPEDKAQFARYWPADLHVMAKEITRQHCIYWPAFLLAADLPLPKAITAHGWLLFDNSKMSKSKGNIVRTETVLDAFGTLCPVQPPSPDKLSHRSDQLSFRSAVGESASLSPETQPTPAPLKGTTSAAEGPSPTPHEPDLFASDVLRYFLLREIPFGQDGSFTFDALITRYNADLANGYGNLVSRTLAMISKSASGVIEACPEAEGLLHWEPGMPEMIGATEGQLLGWKATELIQTAGTALGSRNFAEALTAISALIATVDRFISSRKPWAATDTELSQHGRRSTLYTAAESIRIITALLYPFLPYATANVWGQLGLGDIQQASENGELKNLAWGGLKPGTKLGPLSPVFPRADKGLAQIMTDMEADKDQQKLADQSIPGQPGFGDGAVASEAGAQSVAPPTESTDPAAAPRTGELAEPNPGAQVGGSNATNPERAETPPQAEAPASGIFAAQNASPQITIEDFAKVELRVAKVIVCERIPKADKLLRLVVDLGDEQRQILSGIAEWYAPEDLLGRRIVVITNLAPRKMRGLESHGMLLAASAPEGGKPALATFNDSDELPLGSRLR